MAQAKPINKEAKPSLDELSTRLISQLCDNPDITQAQHLQLAYSGGLDSTVLLHLLHTLKQKALLTADISLVHVHHGLQLEADDWLAHCQSSANKYNFPLIARRVSVNVEDGSSPEEAARDARYAVFEATLPQSAILLQAHHLDDQLETVLLNLLRGSGSKGLAGIPAKRSLGSRHIIRPLLQCSRSELEDYAKQEQLTWIEDHSNQDERYDRNFIRQKIAPLLSQRWPGAAKNVSRSASLCAESDALSALLAQADLQSAQGPQINQLRLDVLSQLSEARVKNLLRFWVAQLKEDLQGADMPYQALKLAVSELLMAAEDAMPCIGWGKAEKRLELRRFQDCLYLLKPFASQPEALVWDSKDSITLPEPLGSINLQVQAGSEYPVFEIRFRQGGESLKAKGRPEKSLKKFLQEEGVPPWLRDRLPLIYLNGELLAIADLAYSESWPLLSGKIQWIRSHLHCGY